MPNYPVVEYVQRNDSGKHKPYLLFNLDLCMPEQEFLFVQEALYKQIENLQNVYVSFVAFNHNVLIYDL